MVEMARKPSSDDGELDNASGLSARQYDRAFVFQTAIADLGQIALRTTPLEFLYQVVSARIGQLLHADLVSIMEVENDCRLRLTGGIGWATDCIGEILSEWGSSTGSAVPAVLQGPTVDGFLGVPPQLRGMVPAGITGISTVQTVPIGAEDSPLGAIGVFTYANRMFVPDEVTFLRSVANILAGAIERSRIEEHARQDAEERTVLAEIGRVIGSSLDIREVYPRFAEQVRRLIDFDRVTINIIDASNGTYKSEYVAGVNIEEWDRGDPMPVSGRGVEAVIRSGAGIIVQGDRITEFLRQFPQTIIGGTSGLNSLMSVPVFWQGEVIGVLAMRSKRKNAYSTTELRTAERIAAQIAGSLANADLHARQREYARQQSTLAEISRVVASSIHIDEIYPKFADAVKKLISFDRISISTVNETDGTATARYVCGTPFKGSAVMTPRPMTGTATGAVSEARAGMIITPEMVDAQPDRFSFVRIGVDAGLKSTLAVPLIFRGRSIGSLVLRSWDENVYTDGDLELAERVAVQISGAVWTARLNERLERSLHEQAVLASLGRGIIQARDTATLFGQLHSALAQCVDFDRIEIGIRDPYRSTLRYEYVRGVDVHGLGQGAEISLFSGPNSSIEWSDMLSTHVGASTRVGVDAPEHAHALNEAGLQSWLQVPLKSRDRTIGILSLRSMRVNAYASSDVHLLETAAAQVAPGLDNVRYFLQAEESNRLGTSLERMVRRFGQTGDRRELLAHFVSEMRDLVPASRVSISAVDPMFAELATDLANSTVNGALVPDELEIVNRDLTRRVFETSSAVIAGGIATEDADFSAYSALRHANSGSSLSVPFLCAGEVAAVLHFHSALANAYGDHHRQVAERAGLMLINALGTARPRFASGTDSQLRAPLPEVIVVDSRPLCRQVLTSKVTQAGVTVAGQCETPEAAAELLVATGCSTLLWELHDDDSPDMSVLMTLRAAYGETRVLVVDGGCGPTVLADAARCGAAGFLNETDRNADGLADALTRVTSGEIAINPAMLREFLSRVPRAAAVVDRKIAANFERMSETDIAILRAVTDGCSNAEIAASLSFAVGTIKNRLARIYRVLGVSDRAGAMALAIKAGLGS